METLKHDKKTSDIFYFSRIIAILAVAVAHTPFHKSDNSFLVSLVDTFACFGVALFFFSSGYYFKAIGYKRRILKSSALLIPWVLFGSLGYLVSALANGFDLLAYLKWIIGWNSYLWFMTVYIVMNFIFEGVEYLHKEKIKESIHLFFFLVMLISRVLMPIFGISGAVAFFNIFNWLGFFALGKYIEMKKFFIIFEQKNALLRGAVCVVALVIFFTIDVLLEAPISYFGYASVFEQLCFIGMMLSLAASFSNIPKIVSRIGKNTLPIYLLHIVPLQWVCAWFPIIIWIYIPLSIGMVMILFYILYSCLFFARKLKMDKLYEKLIGFKL